MDNEAGIRPPLENLFDFDYDIRFPQLDRLYENAKRDQWNVTTTINWEQPVAGQILDFTTLPMFQTELYRSMSPANQQALSRKFAAWRLSQFLHGEQGALLVCGQLVNAVPDLDAKLCAAAQVMDEARHVEAFRRYLTRIDRIYPIDPTLERLLRAVLEHERWEPKYLGMQIIAEGLAIAAFRFMREQTGDQLLRQMLEYILKDESRHVGFGMLALRDGVRNLRGAERKALEDFTFAACDMTVTKVEDGVPRDGFLSYHRIFEEVGISGADLDAEAQRNPGWKDAEHELQRRFNSMVFADTLIPCLKQLGLINERTRPWYEQLGVLAMAA